MIGKQLQYKQIIKILTSNAVSSSLSKFFPSILLINSATPVNNNIISCSSTQEFYEFM